MVIVVAGTRPMTGWGSDGAVYLFASSADSDKHDDGNVLSAPSSSSASLSDSDELDDIPSSLSPSASHVVGGGCTSWNTA